MVLDVIEDTSVMHFRKSDDMLFLQTDESLPSTLCFNYVDNQSGSFEFNYNVMGGFGIFEEATGVLSCTGKNFRVTPGNNAFVAKCEGDLDLPNKRQR